MITAGNCSIPIQTYALPLTHPPITCTPTFKPTFKEEPHPLTAVFDKVITIVKYGEGVRHGGDFTPFYEQSWMDIAKKHGRGHLTGQAAKKINESAQLVEDSFVQEMMNAIAYAGMAILFEQQKTGETKNG